MNFNLLISWSPKVKPSSATSRIRPAILFFAVLLLIPFFGKAQDAGPGTGVLKGRIAEDGEGIPNVHILNLSAERATITNAEGYFNLNARIGDTLLISAIRYERKSFVVTNQMLESPGLRIEMEPFVNQLEEVVLRPYNLSGDLTEDLINLDVEQPVTAASLNLPNAYAKKRTQAERQLIEARSGGAGIPLNPILNAISGRTKMLKKRLARDQAYIQTQEVRARYTDSLFVSDLKIPEIRIPDFMYFCEVDPEFAVLAASEDDLKMWDFLKAKGMEYRKSNELD
jgi:hypothetical protein